MSPLPRPPTYPLRPSRPILCLPSPGPTTKLRGVKKHGTYKGEDLDGVVDTSSAGNLKGLEGEGLLALELVEQLETLESSSLLEVGRDLSSLSSGTLQRK